MVTHLLRLPVEIVRLVCDLGKLEIKVVRSVCKYLNAALLDEFCKVHLQKREDCFILDSACLRRLETITSNPFLAKRIPEVILNLNWMRLDMEVDKIPAEVKTEAFMDEEYEKPGCKAGCKKHRNDRRRDVFDYYCSRGPDLELLTSILRDLKAVEYPRLRLDLDDQPSNTWSREDAHIPEIFEAVVQAGFGPRELDIGELPALNRLTLDDNTVSTFHRSLKMLYLSHCLNDERRTKFSEPEEEHFIETILRNAKNVVSVHLNAVGCSWRRYDGSTFNPEGNMKLVKATLSAGLLSSLHTLKLFGVELDTELLCTVIGDCSETLKHADLGCLVLTPRRPGGWLEILRLLLNECSSLDSLRLRDLMEESQLVVDMTTRHQSCVKLWQTTKGSEWTLEVEWKGREVVLDGLSQNIQRGIEFHKD